MGHDIYIVEMNDENERDRYTAESGCDLADRSDKQLYWTFNYNPAVLGKTSLPKLLHGQKGSDVAIVIVRVASKMMESGVTMGDCLERYVESLNTNDWNWMWGHRLTEKQKNDQKQRRESLGFTEEDFAEAVKEDKILDSKFAQSVALWKLMNSFLPVAHEYPDHYWFSDQVCGKTTFSDEIFVV
jgi:hypothetical protein